MLNSQALLRMVHDGKKGAFLSFHFSASKKIFFWRKKNFASLDSSHLQNDMPDKVFLCIALFAAIAYTDWQ